MTNGNQNEVVTRRSKSCKSLGNRDATRLNPVEEYLVMVCQHCEEDAFEAREAGVSDRLSSRELMTFWRGCAILLALLLLAVFYTQVTFTHYDVVSSEACENVVSLQCPREKSECQSLPEIKICLISRLVGRKELLPAICQYFRRRKVSMDLAPAYGERIRSTRGGMQESRFVVEDESSRSEYPMIYTL